METARSPAGIPVSCLRSSMNIVTRTGTFTIVHLLRIKVF